MPPDGEQGRKNGAASGGLNICSDCMQRAFDAMNNGDMMNQLQHLQNFPNINMINLGDLQNSVPKQQKIKKKEAKEKPEKVMDISSIPAPHKIKPAWTIM